MTDEYYKSFGLVPIKNKAKREQQLVTQLYAKPKKDTGVNMPKFQVLEPGEVHQADLLFMPTDHGYKYILVVVDANSRIKDAEPLKNKDAKTVTEAFKRIYARKILTIPKRMEVDAGSEFKGVTAKYLEDSGVSVRYAKTGRHRQEAIVERANQIIAKALFNRMASQELLTGEISKQWVEDLPKLIEILNKLQKKKKNKINSDGDPVCKDGSCELLAIGTKVRVALDIPREAVTEKRLHGNFRTTDIRWDPKIRTIKEVLIKPNFPPMYLLDGNVGKRMVDPVAYTKNQLQVVSAKEEYPPASVIRGKPSQYVIEEILEKKKVKGQMMYVIKWVGFKKPTLEPIEQIKKNVPEMVKAFESNH